MSTPSEPTDAQIPDETPKREVPFDKDDLTYAPDDVVENSDADPEAESRPAEEGDSATPDEG